MTISHMEEYYHLRRASPRRNPELSQRQQGEFGVGGRAWLHPYQKMKRRLTIRAANLGPEVDICCKLRMKTLKRESQAQGRVREL